jgi:hypothetical protein
MNVGMNVASERAREQINANKLCMRDEELVVHKPLITNMATVRKFEVYI